MSVTDQELVKKLEWAKKNPSLCLYPYEGIDVRLPTTATNSDKIQITCCCNLDSESYIHPPPDPFIKIKKSMDAGILPKECQKCKNEELHGGISERIRGITGKQLSALNEFSDSRSVTDHELRVLFSTVCSLACRICDSGSSSTFAKITKDNSSVYIEKDVSEIEHFYTYIQNSILSNINKYKNYYLHLMLVEVTL